VEAELFIKRLFLVISELRSSAGGTQRQSIVAAALWTNHAKMVDVGANWYRNKFVKVYFDWEHAMFGNPVFSSPGHSQKSNDLFWIRTQLYF
jgi:hypothetical protein